MKVVIYARVSTKDKGQDCENQLADLRAFVAKKAADGWKLAGVYEDYASGKSSERPGFRKLFEDAGRGKFDLVLFWSLDRFSREGALETLKHLERLKAQGIDWYSYKEEFLRSVGPFRDAVLALIATIANLERERMVERVQAGLSRARKQGKKLGRPKACVNSNRVQELRNSGMSIRAIAKAVNASAMTVQRILACQ